MNLASMRIITDDVEKLASFYELISGLKVVRYTPVFAELRGDHFGPGFKFDFVHRVYAS